MGHEFINYELGCDPNNPYIPIEDIIGMLDGRRGATGNKPTKEVDNVEIDDVLVDRVVFKDFERASAILKQFLE